MARAFAELTFTESVRKLQEKAGSAEKYGAFLQDGAQANDRLGVGEAEFIQARDGFYQATVSKNGWPYVQYRGGERGFVKVLGKKTIAYADLRGNRQYLSAGNLADNAKISLIFMDYANRRRLKVWGRAELAAIEGDDGLAEMLMSEGHAAKAERVVVISVEAFDWNCPAHIVQRFTSEELQPVLQKLQGRIAALESENAELRQFLGK